MKLKQLYPLVFSLVLFVGLYLFNSIISNNTFRQSYTDHVKSVFTSYADKMSDDLDEISQQLSNVDSVKFSSVNIDSKSPVFIFQNKKLVYWTGYRYELSHHNIVGEFLYKCIQKNDDIYFIYKITLKNDIEVVTVCPLFIDSHINNQFVKSGLNEEFFGRSEIQLILEFDENIETEDQKFIDYKDNKMLFGLVFPDEFVNKSYSDFFNGICGILILFLLLLQLRIVISFLKKSPQKAFFVLIAGILGIRFLMLYFNERG